MKDSSREELRLTAGVMLIVRWLMDDFFDRIGSIAELATQMTEMITERGCLRCSMDLIGQCLVDQTGEQSDENDFSNKEDFTCCSLEQHSDRDYPVSLNEDLHLCQNYREDSHRLEIFGFSSLNFSLRTYPMKSEYKEIGCVPED
jgi:hypothetical protein